MKFIVHTERTFESEEDYIYHMRQLQKIMPGFNLGDLERNGKTEVIGKNVKTTYTITQ